MSDKCSYRGALDTQAVENHRRVSQQKEQRRIDDQYGKSEPAETKPVIEPGKTKRSKPHKKGSRAKNKGSRMGTVRKAGSKD
jgi:hypothetical protein